MTTAVARRRKRKQRLDAPHVRLYGWELRSPAYRSLSVGARALLVELKSLYNGYNNGNLFLSVREAARRLGCSKDRAARLFVELRDRGFIRPKEIGAFNLKAASGRGMATSWILTEHPTGDAVSGTKEFMHWRPTPPEAVAEIISRSSQEGQPVPRARTVGAETSSTVLRNGTVGALRTPKAVPAMRTQIDIPGG